jgi:hypothetical protein
MPRCLFFELQKKRLFVSPPPSIPGDPMNFTTMGSMIRPCRIDTNMHRPPPSILFLNGCRRHDPRIAVNTNTGTENIAPTRASNRLM